MKPLNNTVIIELPGSQEQTSAAGLWIGSDERKDRGVLIAKGPNVEGVEEDDMVIFNTNAPHSIMEPERGRKMVVIDAEHLLAILEDGEA